MSNANGNGTQLVEAGHVDPLPLKYIVGIGASAGGLESLEQLFRQMPTNSGMAFVVIQHLSPDFKSMMSELLARDTTMRIEVAEDGVRVEANVIYLMPPKKEMMLAGGCLHLSDKDASHGLALPIDRFLESLAREMGEAAIAVILSGSGTDGTRGIQEVARRGGLVISESLDTAKFDGMPASAQATNVVDLVLPPSEIGAALQDYCQNPLSLTRGELERRSQTASLKGIDAILQLFRNVYDIDFSSYKDSTVMRRMRRRLSLAQMESFDEYAEVLKANPDELHLLYSDLLIGVTQFFRDPEIFQFLSAEVLPGVLAAREPNEAIRVWVAGCATGEEAYSMAIAFREAMQATGDSRPLKIFATDVHKRSIDFASRGVYGDDVLAGLQGELLQRYFTTRPDGYQVRPEIRQTIVFAPHNVLRDAPFTDLDFVSCRNLLIYLRPAAQRRAISLLHYGLRVGGVMWLGGSESTGELASEFDAISDRHRVYRKNRDVRLTHNLRSPLTSADSVHRGLLPATPAHRPPPGPARTKQIHDELLDRYMPPSVLIDGSRTVIDTFGGAEQLLRFPSRQPTLDVLNLVDPQLRTMLSGAIGRAMNTQTTARFGKFNLPTRDGTKTVDLTVEPLGGTAGETCYLITFDLATSERREWLDAGAEAPPRELLLPGGESSLEVARSRISQLEDDLRTSNENLQATIEELETSNEELQATNEELIASNEELQSTNEELHSLNEELYSVNSEHQRKIEELAVLNRDMNHLLENTDVATVFLDRELRIRRFTSRVREVFDLIDDDIGRSIHVFGPKLRIEDLAERLQTVLENGTPYEREVRAVDGTCYLMRLLPYRPGDHVDGVIIMWVDVSSLEVLRGRMRWLSAIVESTNDAIIGQDLSGIITSWNRGAEQLYGYSASEMVGKHMDLLIPEDRQAELAEYRDRILHGEVVLSTDTIRLHRDGTPIDVSLTVSPVFNSDQQVIGISKIARDIGERIRMEQEIRTQVQQRERFLAMLSHELRNPLNAVSSATAIVGDHRASDTAKDAAANTIRRQVGMINHLLADLLDVARIAENRITLKFETLDLRELVLEVEEIVQSELDRHGCRVEFDLPAVPIMIKGDRTRLIQVQVNLIQNAAKYSETTNPIRVAITDEDSRVHLSVSDKGKGIPPEKLESIFEPFAQLQRSSKRSDGGLGVGLTLAKSLIELHGGTIYAESKGEAQGSVFHIWLPKLSDLECEQLGSDNAACYEQNGATASQASRRLDICIVEDMDDSRNMIKTLLELDGHRVTAAENGRTAVEMLVAGTFDFALVDIGLPDMSGYDVARRVREQVPSERLTMIALTGYGQPADVEEAFAAGFDDHIVKPLDPQALQRLCESKQSAGDQQAPAGDVAKG